ncbi:MAG TPA: hypothetical protein VGO31_12710 [Microbacteriaceae bacterium]|jgi:hypothetical protein|nr:hypothetical protein [Microbacteriaceae bacterium]
MPADLPTDSTFSIPFCITVHGRSYNADVGGLPVDAEYAPRVTFRHVGIVFEPTIVEEHRIQRDEHNLVTGDVVTRYTVI